MLVDIYFLAKPLPNRPYFSNTLMTKARQTNLCLVPSYGFDFLTAKTLLLNENLERTLMTLPKLPLPTSAISSKSRSKRPGCSYVFISPDGWRERTLERDDGRRMPKGVGKRSVGDAMLVIDDCEPLDEVRHGERRKVLNSGERVGS